MTLWFYKHPNHLVNSLYHDQGIHMICHVMFKSVGWYNFVYLNVKLKMATTVSQEIQQYETGFDCEFVKKPPKELQSECPVCLQILHEPYQVSCCGYSFCRICIEEIKTHNEPCPTCKEENFVTFHNKGLQRLLYGSQVYCSNKQEGCEWKGELGQLDKHLVHYCVSTAIDCDFHHVGCDVRLPRKDMPVHLKENLVTHMSLQAASYSKLLASHNKLRASHKDLQQRVSILGAENESLQERINKLENENETLKYHGSPPCVIELTINDFEDLRRCNESWHSMPFLTHLGGYQFCLRVDPNGHGDGKGTHVSVFINLMKGPSDGFIKWPFCCGFTLQLVDQGGTKQHLIRTLNFDEKVPRKYTSRVTQGDRNDGWGYPQFISHCDLKPKYLKNDCLRLRIIKIAYFYD